MAFIVEHNDYHFYHNFLKSGKNYDSVSFQKYWFAQEMYRSYTEDDYTDFLKCYVGKRLFDNFVDEEGLMGDFKGFCNFHEEAELKSHGLMSLDEDYTTIFNYWLKDYILYWKEHLKSISVSMRKDVIIQMAIKQNELETPCIHNRTVQQLKKSIKSILEKDSTLK